MTWLFLKHNSRYRIQPTDEDNSQLRPVCNRIEGSREQPEPSGGENIRLCVNELNSHSSPDVQTWSVSQNKTAHDPQHCLKLNHLWPLQSSPPNLILWSIICTASLSTQQLIFRLEGHSVQGTQPGPSSKHSETLQCWHNSFSVLVKHQKPSNCSSTFSWLFPTRRQDTPHSKLNVTKNTPCSFDFQLCLSRRKGEHNQYSAYHKTIKSSNPR